MLKRVQYQTVMRRLDEPRKFIQVVMGPRQVGKTTLVKQVLADINKPYLFFSADNVPATQSSWVSDCWNTARSQMRQQHLSDFILVIDEIQKIRNWSEVIKKEWDADTMNDVSIKAVLLGSSRVLLEKGLSESLMGRFEVIRLSHWTYPEMRDAFGVSLDEYIYYGAYPGAASLMNDEERWNSYVESAIIDSTINKDVLLNSPVSKPALLRQTFELAAAYSGEIVSLTKMTGALQDAGNTTTLSGYLNLLGDSGLITGLQKFSIDHSRRRSSPPKFQVYNNALRCIYNGKGIKSALEDRREWGRVFESAVGAYIVSQAFEHRYDVYYWRDGNDEVDYIIRKRDRIAAIEVKSNSERYNKGLGRFTEMFHPVSSLVVGEGGMKPEEFFSHCPMELL